jgi:rhodanese-related sulfurtransferase
VGTDELRVRLERGDTVVLDVRPEVEYAAGHLPGALHIPLQELADRLAELPADQEVIAYCRGRYCVLAHDAVRLLTAHGHHARRAADGLLEWRLAGLPVQTDAA